MIAKLRPIGRCGHRVMKIKYESKQCSEPRRNGVALHGQCLTTKHCDLKQNLK